MFAIFHQIFFKKTSKWLKGNVDGQVLEREGKIPCCHSCVSTFCVNSLLVFCCLLTTRKPSEYCKICHFSYNLQNLQFRIHAVHLVQPWSGKATTPMVLFYNFSINVHQFIIIMFQATSIQSFFGGPHSLEKMEFWKTVMIIALRQNAISATREAILLTKI